MDFFTIYEGLMLHSVAVRGKAHMILYRNSGYVFEIIVIVPVKYFRLCVFAQDM